MLLQNQVPFDSISKTIVKTIVMMLGEYEYESIFQYFIEDHDQCGNYTSLSANPELCPEWSLVNYYSQVTFVMFIAFVIVMPIIISNMLIGLAVDDIKGVQD